MIDIEKLQKQHKRFYELIKNSSFYSFIHQDIIDRLDPLLGSFNRVLIIQSFVDEVLSSYIKEEYHPVSIEYIDHFYNLSLKPQFDLVIFPMGFHTIHDIPHFLHQIKMIIKDSGILICCFPGGGSLVNLRRLLIQLESYYNLGHKAHVYPFIQFEHVVPLLQQSGFIESIIDMEILQLEYSTPVHLMHAIKQNGEGNVLNAKACYSITKDMYLDLSKNEKEPFIDSINLITFIAAKNKKSIILKSKHYRK